MEHVPRNYLHVNAKYNLIHIFDFFLIPPSMGNNTISCAIDHVIQIPPC